MKNILWITIAIFFAFQLSSKPVEAGWPSVDFPSDAGITLQKGSTYNILWSSVNTDPVDIKLCNEIEPGYIDCFYDIALNVPNSGQYSWTVPASLPNNSNYVVSVGKILVSGASSDFPFTIGDQIQTPLLPPRLSYRIDGVRASISWPFVSGATGYKFYYAPFPFSGPESIAEIDMGTQTTLSADLWEGASFLVAVQSYNDQENSNYSNIETITIPYTSAPESPQLSYSLDGTSLYANWEPVPGATGYRLYYTLSAYTGQEAFLPVDVGNQTSFTYAGLSEGQTYSIAVVSYNIAGESSFSNIETFTPSTVTEGSSGEYEITYQMLRKNSYPEGASGSPYRGYIQLTKDGQIINPSDFIDGEVRNSKGEIIQTSRAPDVYVVHGIRADCTNGECSWRPYSESGITFYFDYTAFPLDNYTFTIDMVDEQLMTTLPVNENLSIPVIDSQTMQASWQGEDLALKWVNPTNELNWERVNKLRIYLYGTDSYCGTIYLNSSSHSVLLPKEMINDMACGTPIQWNMQTRVEPENSLNFQIARGYSNTVTILP